MSLFPYEPPPKDEGKSNLLFPYTPFIWNEQEPLEPVPVADRVRWGIDNATIANKFLDTIEPMMAKWKFLDERLHDPANAGKPGREDAIGRQMNWHGRITRAIFNAVFQEDQADRLVWKFLTPEQRHDAGLDQAWLADADRPDLVGVILSWPQLAELDVKAWCGPLNWLHYVIPRRGDIIEYIRRGFILPPDRDTGKFAKAIEREERKKAIIAKAARKWQ
jgi:hypothetical protein